MIGSGVVVLVELYVVDVVVAKVVDVVVVLVVEVVEVVVSPRQRKTFFAPSVSSQPPTSFGQKTSSNREVVISFP